MRRRFSRTRVTKPACRATHGSAAPRCGASRPKCSAREKGSQRIEIPLVERIDVDRALRVALPFRRFEQHRQPAEPAVVDDPPKWLQPEASLTDVLVAIDAAAE